MKPFATTILLFFGQLVCGQWSPDTCITKSQLYQLKYEIYYQKDIKNDLLLKIRMITDLKKADTSVNTRDSVIIHYFNGVDSIFRTVKKRYSGSCLRDSLITHYNNYGLTEYIENWSTDCNADTTNGEYYITTYKNYYSRYEYDKARRIIKYVFHLATPHTRRLIFNYDSSGKETRRSESISDADFWD